MNPVIFQIGPLAVRAFAAWLALAALAAALIVVGAARLRGEPPLRWLDCLLIALVFGVVGARAGHVMLHWDYFATHTDEILDLRAGGLDWHGALLLATPAALIMARWRRVSWSALSDALALGLPFAAVAVWQGCAAASCGYGAEVRTLADHPLWLVAELPDIYGTLAPRYNLPPLGTALAAALLALLGALTLFDWLRGGRLGLAVLLYSLAMFALGALRGEGVPTWFGMRADQALDLLTAAAGVGLLVAGRGASRYH
jgi:phosphatidylglycerol:prolipoprotein diacylglycerol transferase